MFGSRAPKRRLAIAGFACLAGVASAPLAVMSYNDASDLALPGVQAAERLMAMLDARSPGERAAGALTQTKLRLASSPRKNTPVKPQPPVTPPIEELARIINPVPPALPVDVVPPILPPPAAAEIIPPASLLASAPPGFSSGIIGGGGGFVAPPGSSAPPTSEVPPPPVTSAVPEPGTWAMMLLGFAMIGSATRRRKIRAAAVA